MAMGRHRVPRFLHRAAAVWRDAASPLTKRAPMRFLSTLRQLAVFAVIAGGATVAAVRPVTAQGTGTIRGMVTDSTTQQPIVGAQVQVVGTSLGAATGPSGEYVIRGAT